MLQSSISTLNSHQVPSSSAMTPPDQLSASSTSSTQSYGQCVENIPPGVLPPFTTTHATFQSADPLGSRSSLPTWHPYSLIPMSGSDVAPTQSQSLHGGNSVGTMSGYPACIYGHAP